MVIEHSLQSIHCIQRSICSISHFHSNYMNKVLSFVILSILQVKQRLRSFYKSNHAQIIQPGSNSSNLSQIRLMILIVQEVEEGSSLTPSLGIWTGETQVFGIQMFWLRVESTLLTLGPNLQKPDRSQLLCEASSKPDLHMQVCLLCTARQYRHPDEGWLGGQHPQGADIRRHFSHQALCLVLGLPPIGEKALSKIILFCSHSNKSINVLGSPC